MSALTFKIADQPQEFEQIFKLNYKTFVEEIPQRAANPEQRLSDKFRSENTYFICMAGARLVGTLAVRDKRPFSLDATLENLDSYLPPNKSMCELRLLAVQPDRRRTRAFAGLALLVARYFDERGYDLGIMSGITRQLKLYRHLGFTPFGPLVGKEGAYFQPMYLTLDSYRRLRATARIFRKRFLGQA